MELKPEDFDQKFKEALDKAIEHMAENPDIALTKFYGLTCFLENLAFFSPVLYGIITDSKKC